MNSSFKNRLDITITIKNKGRKLIYTDDHLECSMGIFKGRKEYMMKDVNDGD